MTTLLVAEHDNNSLGDSVKKAISAAKLIGEEIDILVAGKIVQMLQKNQQNLKELIKY